MREKFVRCRAVGHLWEDVEAERNPAFGFYMMSRCSECHTLRRHIISLYGEIISRGYSYPDGYRDTRTRAFTRAEWRELFLRKTRKKGITKL